MASAILLITIGLSILCLIVLTLGWPGFGFIVLAAHLVALAWCAIAVCRKHKSIRPTRSI